MGDCLNCQSRLPPHQRFFCNDACRQEYHKRGMKPRPPVEIVKPNVKLVCHMCGTPLTGKQRRWCSDKCRKNAERLLKTGQTLNRESDRWCPGLSGYLGDSVGVKRQGRLIVTIETVQIVEYLDVYDPIYHLLTQENLKKLAKMLESLINREIFGNVATVEVKRG